ncbi:hypothetical protein M9Y10_031277 [Tritrichomonas musculus]|uniref:KilA-N domain-containing protein n=1 Tax=Tritrichomonas musculus TaxID=1915356 RepID=A0ABR2H1B8_9EUKA
MQNWYRNSSTQELLEEIRRVGDFSGSKNIYEKREDLPNGLRGYYVHRILVNHVAIWCSPRYSYYIMKLLDSVFERTTTTTNSITTTTNKNR